MNVFELTAEPRSAVGKGASRRLRREGKLPAILYGGQGAPESLVLTQQEVLRRLENEAFYSHILEVKIGSRTERAVLRDLQRHPYKPIILHMDLQRVSADQKIRVHVPLHFINEETAIGVKVQGGAVSHLRIEVEVATLPENLPEYIEVDLANLELGQSIRLSELALPPGVEIVELSHGGIEQHDVPVVSIQGRRAAAEEDEAETGTEGSGAATPAAP